MKKTLITTALLLAAITAVAQTSEMTVFTNERPIGRIIETQEEIIAKQYMFPERIYHSYVDTIAKTITVQLRKQKNNKKWNNKGVIIFYDLSNEKVNWSKKISYQKNTINQSGSTIILTDIGKDKSYLLGAENGKSLWEINRYINIIDTIANIGIGYEFEAIKRYNDVFMLEWIDLKTGKTLWKKEFNKEYGVNEIFKLNDYVWMIVADGLHTLNVHSGNFWSYNAVTGKKKYGRMIAANAAGIALGLFSGTYLLTAGHDLVRNVASNVCSDNTGIYFASKEKIARINEDNGTIIWSCPLQEDLTSKSFLFTDNNHVFMVNCGYAFMGNRLIDYGTPFFAAYDKETGEQIFFSTINITKNPILNFKIKDNNLLLLFKDRFMKYSLSDGAKIIEKTIDNNEFGELRGFVGNSVYIDIGNSYLANLIFSDVSKNFIFTTNNRVLIFDDELNYVGDIRAEQLYIARLRIGDYLLVMQNNKTFILDTDNKKVMEIDTILNNPVLIGDKLYSIRESSFFEIDAANLIEQLQSIQNRRRDVMANF